MDLLRLKQDESPIVVSYWAFYSEKDIFLEMHGWLFGAIWSRSYIERIHRHPIMPLDGISLRFEVALR
ncbi:hypothetical protein, partial [Thalassotalea sp. Y01]|uniref:hypothetical protein n=1 Tax=Thalassotalea sp. Y01 TaxID=2729613 RepID=UPI001B7D6C9D